MSDMRERLRRRRTRREADRRDPTAAQRWRRRPLLAFCVRLLIFLLPIAATLVVSIGLSRTLPAPTDRGHEVLWWVAIIAVSLVVFVVADLLCRRALPLVALLQLSMLFPDRAPRRFKVARGRGRVKELTAELERAVDRDPDDPATRGAVTVLTLIASLTVHDGRTRGHSERVRIFSDMTAEEMGVSEDDRYRLRWAALLHDIGKLEVPASILNKPGRPDDEEWVQLRRHPETAARLLGPLHEWLGEWKLAAEQHHEHYDGTGYPKGLRGEEISLGGRIVCVADCFETMTAARPYKKTMSAVAAREELVRNAGTQFDPAVCRAFLNISLGRLWRGLGLAAFLGQLPLLAPFTGTLTRWGGQAASMTAAVATGAGLAAGGLFAIPNLGIGGGGAPAVSRLPAPTPAPAPAPVPAPGSTTPPAPSAPITNGAAPPTGGPVSSVGPLPGTGALPVPPAPTTPPSPPLPGQAAGDAYALEGDIALLPGMATLGPVAPSTASASSSRPTSHSSAAGCGPGASPCPAGVDEVSLGGSGTIATVEAGHSPDCGPGAPPAGFETGPLTPPAAAACTTGLRMSAGGPLGLLVDGGAAESITQGCALAPAGHASVSDVELGGQRLAGGAALTPNTWRTVAVAGLPTAMLVTLDEQIPDATGRGLTVNAVHISGGGVDVIVGHAHSAVGCPPGASAPAPAKGPSPAGRGSEPAVETAGCFGRLHRASPPDRIGLRL